MGYWENRQAKAMYDNMRSAEEVSKELADIYAKASRYLSYEIDGIYEKFRDKHSLTDKEAMALLNTLKNKNDIAALKQALAGKAKTDPGYADILSKLESQAYGARIERLEQLQTEIDRMMKEVYKQEKKVTTSHYKDLAENSYYREIYNVQRRVGFQFSFSAVDPKKIDLLLRSTWSGANYSARIWKNTQGLADEVKEQLIIGLLTGKREEEMAKEIANKYATGAFEARRLVRTESNFVNGQMQLAAYEECNAEQYEFVATLDLLTSKACRELDGKVFPVKDAKPGVNMNPMHPFCRSTTIIHLGGDVVPGLKRRARDPETGENKLVPASMNYKEWYKQNISNNPKAQAAEKALKNKGADAVLYEKYKRIYGSNEVGKDLEAFQYLKYTDVKKWESLKTGKQQAINSLSEKKIASLNGMLGNQETRLWYKHMDEHIPDILDKTKSLEEQARRAHELRNQYRTQARDLMIDQNERRRLDADHKNLTFEQLMERKKAKYGLTGDDAYKDIIRSSTTTNKMYDKKAGL